jgi:aromatic-L-amino-acid decarboxylase
LNQHLLTAVENSGEAFLSNAVIGGKFVLRACIVNFRTSSGDIEALSLLLSRLGEEADTTLRPERVKLGDDSGRMGHGNGRVTMP